MISAENSLCLLRPVVCNEPSGAFWDKVDASDLNQRWRSLEDAGNSPAPAVGDLEGPVGYPCGNDGAQILPFSQYEPLKL